MELIGATLVTVPASLTAASVRAFQSALDVAATGDRRPIVLRSSEAAVFCRGMDLGAAASGADEDAVEAFATSLRTIRFAGTPVIAFVEGEALGGGVGIAAAADLVLATPDAGFALPELLFGLAPAIVLPYLAERVVPQKVRSLALLSERLDAATAMRIGLVDRVEAPDRCAGVLRTWLARVGRPRADTVEAWKNMTATVPRAGSRGGARLTAAALADPRVRERLARFAEQGTPPWTSEGT